LFDLKAKLSLIDKFSGPLKKAQSQLEKLNQGTKHTRDSLGRLRDEQGRFVRENKMFNGSINGSLGGLKALAAGAITAVGAYNLLNSTVGEAARMELAQISVGALFKEDKKSADEFFSFLNKSAKESFFGQKLGKCSYP
jgi:phage tail tape-measure protein